MKKPVDDDRLITMLGLSDFIWAGSLHGNIYVFRMDNFELHKTFAGHHDSVCCLCSILDMYVISSSAQNDTSIAVWENLQTSDNETNSLASSLANSTTKLIHANTNSSRLPRKIKRKEDSVKSIDIL